MGRDTISRKAVIKTIREWWREAIGEGDPLVISDIKNLPPSDEGWIPVKKRLPKLIDKSYEDEGMQFHLCESNPVYITYRDDNGKNRVFLGPCVYNDNGMWYHEDSCHIPVCFEVLAWRPPLKPYKDSL